ECCHPACGKHFSC
uniref:Alpha-conotoxin GII n=2 Tax=Conus geographus TaxID=6491 RepID=CA12_CONGE|nr:RecName: Full=Alpha-conotoxin GII [Conus geographus]